jgi:hypothetical protein
MGIKPGPLVALVELKRYSVGLLSVKWLEYGEDGVFRCLKLRPGGKGSRFL